MFDALYMAIQPIKIVILLGMVYGIVLTTLNPIVLELLKFEDYGKIIELNEGRPNAINPPWLANGWDWNPKR